MSEREIFLGALDISDPLARERFLDGLGIDPTQRVRIDSLLRSHATAGSFLSDPAVAPLEPFLFEKLSMNDEAIPDSDPNTPDTFDFLQVSTRPDSLGRLGHYEVLQLLGHGGFGIVFRAFDDMLQRVVALKVLAPHLAATSPARKRFLREAQSAARVRHANVVQIHAVEKDPLPYLVMEYIPGESLQQRLDRSGPLETMEVVQIAVQIAEGLAAAHATGLIHRDIKPANILLESTANPQVKITDFGLARAADDASLTQSGLVAGTPSFMAPEQASEGSLDHRADLFSLGSVLYTMCAGRPPFRAKTTLAVLKRVAEDTPRPIRDSVPEVPQWLCDIIAKLHEKSPDDRIATARELADLLANGLAIMQRSWDVIPGPVSGPVVEPQSRVSRAVLPRGRRTLRTIAAAVLAVVVLAGLSEASGVTKVSGTIVRLFSPEGTLVVEVNDPGVTIQVDGEAVVITGAGVKEIRLKPGSYTVEARKDGKVVSRELVSVTSNGRQVVRILQEPATQTTTSKADAAWESSVAKLSPEEQVKAVSARLMALNPGFDGVVRPTLLDGKVTGLQILTDEVVNIAPVRAIKGLTWLDCKGTFHRKGKLQDLTPLQGLPLKFLDVAETQVRDLSPLKGMPLTTLNLMATQVQDLSPLAGMRITDLNLSLTNVDDLASLKGMPLKKLELNGLLVRELSPLKGMPLTRLSGHDCTEIRDLSPLAGMPLTFLHLWSAPIIDLEPLKGMPLRFLSVGHSRVRDLRALKGTDLTFLNLTGCTQVKDLEPVADLPIKTLIVTGTGVTDVKPLLGLPLVDLRFDPRKVTENLEKLRGMKSLETIGIDHREQFWPAAEFWTRYDKGEFSK